jgi:hypothetical protein
MPMTRELQGGGGRQGHLSGDHVVSRERDVFEKSWRFLEWSFSELSQFHASIRNFYLLALLRIWVGLYKTAVHWNFPKLSISMQLSRNRNSNVSRIYLANSKEVCI